ncbi:hypothetical protein [Coxiella burnetii]|nr:hypothetical protein [Coxiella burnetii]
MEGNPYQLLMPYSQRQYHYGATNEGAQIDLSPKEQLLGWVKNNPCLLSNNPEKWNWKIITAYLAGLLTASGSTAVCFQLGKEFGDQYGKIEGIYFAISAFVAVLILAGRATCRTLVNYVEKKSAAPLMRPSNNKSYFIFFVLGTLGAGLQNAWNTVENFPGWVGDTLAVFALGVPFFVNRSSLVQLVEDFGNVSCVYSLRNRIWPKTEHQQKRQRIINRLKEIRSMLPGLDKEVLRKWIQEIQKITNEEERLKAFFMPLREKAPAQDEAGCLQTFEKTIGYLGLIGGAYALIPSYTAGRKAMEGFLPWMSRSFHFSGGWVKTTGGGVLCKLLGINSYIMNAPLPMVASQEVFRKFF